MAVTINSLSPSSGPAAGGDTVGINVTETGSPTISGVTFGGASVPFSVQSASLINATSRGVDTGGPVAVEVQYSDTAGAGNSNDVLYTYLPRPAPPGPGPGPGTYPVLFPPFPIGMPGQDITAAMTAIALAQQAVISQVMQQVLELITLVGPGQRPPFNPGPGPLPPGQPPQAPRVTIVPPWPMGVPGLPGTGFGSGSPYNGTGGFQGGGPYADYGLGGAPPGFQPPAPPVYGPFPAVQASTPGLPTVVLPSPNAPVAVPSPAPPGVPGVAAWRAPPTVVLPFPQGAMPLPGEPGFSPVNAPPPLGVGGPSPTVRIPLASPGPWPPSPSLGGAYGMLAQPNTAPLTPAQQVQAAAVQIYQQAGLGASAFVADPSLLAQAALQQANAGNPGVAGGAMGGFLAPPLAARPASPAPLTGQQFLQNIPPADRPLWGGTP